MSKNTYVVILTENKNVLYVLNLIETSIKTFWLENIEDFNSCPRCLKSGYGSFIFKFSLNGEPNEFWVYFDCDADYSHIYPGSKIILSLGHSSNSNRIINFICNDLKKEFSSIYIDYKDDMSFEEF